MAQRDKNGETASERIARKFLAGEEVNECNTYTIKIVNGTNLILYNSRIAWLNDARDYLHIYDDHQFSGSRLTKERKHAIITQAKRMGKIVEES